MRTDNGCDLRAYSIKMLERRIHGRCGWDRVVLARLNQVIVVLGGKLAQIKNTSVLNTKGQNRLVNYMSLISVNFPHDLQAFHEKPPS